jgi:GDP-mannose 6-dehydrogenase
MNVALFGLGYVGTVTAACLAAHGHRVWGVDPDATKVALINDGRSPVVEPGLDEMVAQAVGSGALVATSVAAAALANAEVVLLCVGTPSRANGGADLTAIERAASQIGAALAASDRYVSVVVRSTVPPGTVEDVVAPVIAARSGKELGVGIGLAMCPEFLREGTGLEDFFNPPFTVVGSAHEQTIAQLAELFGFIPRPMHVMPVREAESLKYACNAFHAVKVSFTNELARLYRHLGVDAREVMRVFVEDDRLNISPAYLRPGFAFGGSCLPKDLRSLLAMARSHDLEMRVLSGALATNEHMVDDAYRLVQQSTGKVVALLGLSFKSETDDLRESPFVELAERLIGKGYELRIHDPIVNPARLFGANLRYVKDRLPHLHRVLVGTVDDALDGCDVAIIAVPNREVEAEIVLRKPDLVIDLCGRLGDEIEQLPGYIGIGW